MWIFKLTNRMIIIYFYIYANNFANLCIVIRSPLISTETSPKAITFEHFYRCGKNQQNTTWTIFVQNFWIINDISYQYWFFSFEIVAYIYRQEIFAGNYGLQYFTHCYVTWLCQRSLLRALSMGERFTFSYGVLTPCAKTNF